MASAKHRRSGPQRSPVTCTLKLISYTERINIRAISYDTYSLEAHFYCLEGKALVSAFEQLVVDRASENITTSMLLKCIIEEGKSSFTLLTTLLSPSGGW
jgi:hypothetical protein